MLVSLALQCLSTVLGGILALTGVLKLVTPSDSTTGMTVLDGFVQNRRLSQVANRGLALAEICAAGLCLWPQGRAVGSGLALALFVGASIAIHQALQTGSTANCGCAGRFSSDAVSASSLRRAASFGALALLTGVLALIVTDSVPGRKGVWASVVGAVIVAVLVASSAEFRGWRGRAAATARQRTSDLAGGACANARFSARRVQRAVVRSQAWSRVAPLVRPADLDKADMWREGCWVYMAVPAAYEAIDAIVVVGAHILALGQVRAVVTSLDDEQVLAEFV